MELFFFLYKPIFLSVLLNTYSANSFNHSFVPHVFIEPGMIPGTRDSAGNTDRVPALREFTLRCVSRGGVRKDEIQINLCAMCQVVQTDE